MLHLLWECEVAKIFWKNVCNWINQSSVALVGIEVTQKLVLLGSVGNFVPDPEMDLILLLANNIYQQTARNCSECSRFQVYC